MSTINQHRKGTPEMSTINQQKIRYLPPEGGETLWILGDQVTFKTDGERDGLTLFVSTIPLEAGRLRMFIICRRKHTTSCRAPSPSSMGTSGLRQRPARSFGFRAACGIPSAIEERRPGGSSRPTLCLGRMSVGSGTSACRCPTEPPSSLPRGHPTWLMCWRAPRERIFTWRSRTTRERRVKTRSGVSLTAILGRVHRLSRCRRKTISVTAFPGAIRA